MRSWSAFYTGVNYPKKVQISKYSIQFLTMPDTVCDDNIIRIKDYGKKTIFRIQKNSEGSHRIAESKDSGSATFA